MTGRDILVNGLIVTGCLLLIAGTAMFSLAAALVVAGLVCLAVGFIVADEPRRR